MFHVLAVLIALLAASIVTNALLVWNQRQQERISTGHREHLYRELAKAHERTDLRDARIRELEDALYAKHAAVLELPNLNREPPAPVEQPLPASVQQFIDGFTEPEVRDEFAEEARHLMVRSPNLSSTDIIARLAGGVTAG
jgi:hypothetical protein